MSLSYRGKLSNNDNDIDDILRIVGMSTSSFDDNKSINLIATNAPVNPFADNITDFFSNYTSGQYEMGWFRNYNQFANHTGSDFANVPGQQSSVQIGGTNISMNALGWNTRPALVSHYPNFDEAGQLSWTSSSLYTFTYRTTANSNQNCRITSIGINGAANVYNGNIDTETLSTTVQSFGSVALERSFKDCGKGVVAYRNSASSARTWVRVFEVSTAGTITFENAAQLSTKYNQLFNKSLNVGNNRALFASMRGGNDINLHYFQYNSTNNYTTGSVQVASTQHAGYPTMAYVNDDLVVYIYTRRPSSSGDDRYINMKLYDISSFPPTLLGTATEYDTTSQRIGRMGDAAVAANSGDNRTSFGVFIYNDVTNYQGQAVPFKVTTTQEYASSPTIEILPTGTSRLSAPQASQNADVSNSFKAPHHLIQLGERINDPGYFYYLAVIAPGYGWIFKQRLSNGTLTNVRSGEMSNLTANNNYRRADYHYFGASGNGHRGLPAGSFEFEKTSLIVAGENGDDGGDMYVAGAGIVLD